MAGHLAKVGHDVTVYNRTRGKAEAWVEQHGGRLGETPAKAAEGAEVVFSCVGNDDDLRSVVLGDDGSVCRAWTRARCSSITPPVRPPLPGNWLELAACAESLTWTGPCRAVRLGPKMAN